VASLSKIWLRDDKQLERPVTTTHLTMTRSQASNTMNE